VTSSPAGQVCGVWPVLGAVAVAGGVLVGGGSAKSSCGCGAISYQRVEIV